MNLQSLLAILAAATLAVAGGAAQAEGFPAKPVRLVVPQAPGGASDALARIVGQKLSERWGQPVVVENRVGAGGNIGTEAVAKSAADCYTLLMAYVGTHAINAALYKKLPFDPNRDFATVATLATVPFVMVVNAAVAAKDVQELVALARTKPGGLTYASAGNGSVNHLLGEMFNMATKVKLVHVPYKGAAPALTDLISGQVQIAFTSMPSVIQHIRAGTLRALAVTSARRSATLPDVPTLAEFGLAGFDVNPWFGILGPAGTPAETVKQINADIGAVLRMKEVQERFAGQGAEPFITTPEQFNEFARADVAKWAVVVKESGATVD